MDIGSILVALGVGVLWLIGLGGIAIFTTSYANVSGFNDDESDALGGVAVLSYLAFSAIGLGLYL